MATRKESPTTSMRALRPPTEPNTIVLVISGRIARGDIAALCKGAGAWLNGGSADRVVCDVRGVVDPDVAAVDALARLQLTAGRLGHRVRLRHASVELQELLALAGLCDVVPPCEDLVLEPRGQTKEGKQASGVEEEADPGDLAV